MRAWHRQALIVTALFGSALTQAAPAFAQDTAVAAAIADRDRGDYPGAIRLLRVAAGRHPTDADVLRLLGTTLAFAKRYGEAIEVLRRARTLSPHDADIGLALSRALLWSGHLKEADIVAVQVAANDPGNGELGEVQRDIAAAYREAPRIGLGIAETGSRVRIGTIDRDWFETNATISVPVRSRTTIVAGIDVEDRQTSTDAQLTLRANSHIGKGFVYLGGTATPSATFREQWSALAGGAYPVMRLIDVSVDLRHAHYPGVNVTVVEPGVAIHSVGGTLALAIHLINLFSNDSPYRSGWSLRGEAKVFHSSSVFAGAATYPDTEAGVTRRVRSFYTGATIPISSRLNAELVFNHEVRRDSYTLDALTLGVRWRLGR